MGQTNSFDKLLVDTIVGEVVNRRETILLLSKGIQKPQTVSVSVLQFKNREWVKQQVDTRLYQRGWSTRWTDTELFVSW